MSDFNTYDLILNRMLNRVNTKVDKREGSVLFDAVAPAAVELYNFEILRQAAVNETFGDTATRKYLIRRCAERGITPKAATYAIIKGLFKPETLEVPIGSRYSCDDFNYVITKKLEDGIYELKCETVGSAPNSQMGRLLPIDHVNGLKSAEIIEISIYGEDEESTESLRARYFSSMQAEAFGGNLLDYRNKILSIAGVGAVKLYSGAKWNGGGTVKAVIATSEYTAPSFDLVNKVQTEIDPEMNMGEGIGIAPVGHFVTVVGAYETTVNVGMTLTLEDWASWGSVRSEVETTIDNYLASLNANWQNTNKITVRLAQIESRVLNISGIIDIRSTTINGKTENLTVGEDSLVIRGTVNGD